MMKTRMKDYCFFKKRKYGMLIVDGQNYFLEDSNQTIGRCVMMSRCLIKSNKQIGWKSCNGIEEKNMRYGKAIF